MEQQPQQIEQRFSPEIGPCQIVPDSRCDITECQPHPLPPNPPAPWKKLTSLIICQTKHYSSWFRSAMLALRSQCLLSLRARSSQPWTDCSAFCALRMWERQIDSKIISHEQLSHRAGRWVSQIGNGNQESKTKKRKRKQKGGELLFDSKSLSGFILDFDLSLVMVGRWLSEVQNKTEKK